MERTRITRRSLLQAVGGGAAAIAGGALLGACGESSGSTNSLQKNESVKPPAYQRYQGVKPDLPPTDAGVMACFLRYPDNPASCVDGKPGTGSSVSALIEIFGAVPPSPPKNQYWSNLNQALGVDLKLDMVLYSNMAEKLAVTVAGDDIPDIVQLVGSVANTPQLLAAKFQPLTQFVSGDAVKDYPLLANLTTDQWATTVYNGEIYGLPIPRERVCGIMFCRDDIFRALGVNPQPSSFAEFKSACQQLSDPRKHRWAVGYWQGIIPFIQSMLGAPNVWKVEGGKFTSEYEDETFKQALSDARSLVATGCVHPDAFTASPPIQDWFGNGTTPTIWTGYTAWTGWVANYLPQYPQMDVAAMLPPNYDSNAKAVIRQGTISYSTTVFKKAKPDRIRELLRVANYLAAPFGTKEYMIRRWGVEGVHFTNRDGVVSLTTRGTTEDINSVGYIADAPWALYEPGHPEEARKEYEYQLEAVPKGIPIPTNGLYSNTNSVDGAKLTTMVTDAQADILQGRAPVSHWDDVMRQWRAEGGDKIRKEYEEAYAATK